MKRISLIQFIIIPIFSFSQNIPIDFEASGNGSDWTWTVFENDSNPPLEIVPNPDPSGINSSETVAKFTALQTGQPFAGCESLHGSDIGSFSLNNDNCTVSIMVWKPIISDVGIKFVGPNNGAQIEIKVSNTLINQWEELTFDFSSRIGVFPVVKDQIVIFPDFDLNGRAQDNVIYFDNVYDLSSNTGISTPPQLKIVAYPNPSTDQVIIDIPNPNDNVVIQVFDLTGNLVKTTQSRAVSLKALSKGIYVFKITYSGNAKFIKVIKE
tara:strand:+ start:2090 stop:2890 length:801 start_codon:yes stop_codon:yes gene_type:complete